MFIVQMAGLHKQTKKYSNNSKYFKYSENFLFSSTSIYISYLEACKSIA